MIERNRPKPLSMTDFLRRKDRGSRAAEMEERVAQLQLRTEQAQNGYNPFTNTVRSFISKDGNTAGTKIISPRPRYPNLKQLTEQLLGLPHNNDNGPKIC